MTMTIVIKDGTVDVQLSTNELYEVFSSRTVYDNFIEAMVRLRYILDTEITLQKIKESVHNAD